MADLFAAAKDARRRNLPHLEKMFLQLANAASRSVPKPHGGKPRIAWVTDHKGWCGDRLSNELAKLLPDYECTVAHLGDAEHLSLNADLYIYRNPCWIKGFPLPEWAFKRIVCIVESHRTLDMGDGALLPKVRLVVPMNAALAERVRAIPGTQLWGETIANGVNAQEFKPAQVEPEEFIVGCAGNFSAQYYDNWKGFSNYIVPACKMADVKLDWCSWMGLCYSMPGISGKYVAPEKMGEWYRGLSAFVLMSKSEGCSGVTFEAMASGLPVISTNTGWHGENRSKGIIWTSRPKNETPGAVRAAICELASHLRELKQNHELRRKLGAENRAFALQYSHVDIARQWKKVISSCLPKS